MPGELRVVLHPPSRGERSSRSLVTWIPDCQSRSATAIGNVGGATAFSTPSALQALTTTPRSTSSRGRPCAIRSSNPNSSYGCGLRPARNRGDPVDLERGRDRVPRAVPLDVQERIGHEDRHLVPHRRRADGVGVDQDVRHGPRMLMPRLGIDGRSAAARAGAGRRVGRGAAAGAPGRSRRSSTRTSTSATTSTGWSATTTTSSASWSATASRARSCSAWTSPTGTRPSVQPNDRTLEFAERSEGRLIPFVRLDLGEEPDRGGRALPRPRRPRDQAPPARAALPPERRASRAGVRNRRRATRADPDPRRPRTAADRRRPRPPRRRVSRGAADPRPRRDRRPRRR